MNRIKKALKWAYEDSIKYIAFLLFLFFVIAFVELLLIYPWQTIATIVGGFVVYVLFLFFYEYDK